eukprot:g7485.t1
MYRENCRLSFAAFIPSISKLVPNQYSRITPVHFTVCPYRTPPRAIQPSEITPSVNLVELLHDPVTQKLDFEALDQAAPPEVGLDVVESDISTPSPVKKKKGWQKGVKLNEAHKLAIRLGSKGKNKYKRTELHRSRVGMTMKRRWAERKAAGKERRPIRCSVCGKIGHNKQTCPETPPSAKTKHKMPRSFEHKWKIADGRRRYHEEVKKRYHDQTDDIKSSTIVKKTKRVVTCGYCGKPGHTRRNCPELKAAAEKQGDKKGNPQVPKIKMSDVEDLQRLYTVPLDVESMWKLALDCSVLAWRSGVNRQRMEFTFPTLLGGGGGSMDDAMFSLNNDISRQFQVAALIMESVLKGLKSQPKLQGRLEVGVLDEMESAVYWEGKEIGAILFPQPQSLDMIISRGMMRRKAAPSLLLMVNPQWQPGQVVSDFGFGPLRTLRENFVDSFEDVFYMKQISVFTDTVIVMRCYPSQWQVHLVKPPSNKIELIGTSREKPSFEKIMSMLRTTESSVSRLHWMDRLKMRYVQGRKPCTLFPLTLTKTDFHLCIERADASITERVEALNANLPKLQTENEAKETVKETDQFRDVDIITDSKEFVDSMPFSGRSRSAERSRRDPPLLTTDPVAKDELDTFAHELHNEIKAQNEALKAKVIQLNRKISTLQTEVDTNVIELERKADRIERLETSLTEEHNRQEEVASHYKELLKDQDDKIREREHQVGLERMSMHRQLEQQSKNTQDTNQQLEKERRDWMLERDMLQSEFDGTRQLVTEQEKEIERKHQEVLAANDVLRKLRAELEELNLKYEAELAEKQVMESSLILEMEFKAKEEEISELRSRLTQVTQIIRESHRKTDNEIRSLRRALSEALSERDQLKIELHSEREKLNGDDQPVSGTEDLAHLAETCSRLEAQLEEVRIELNEEREISQSAQSRLEDQLQINTQLESENIRLRTTLETEADTIQDRHISSDAATAIHPNLLQLQETLNVAQSQVVGIVARKRSLQNTQYISALNITLQEAQHQLGAMTTKVEESPGIASRDGEVDPTSREESPKRRRFSIERRFKYLSARCQLYQTFHFAREGRHRRNATERVFHSHSMKPSVVGRSRNATTTTRSEPLSEIQVEAMSTRGEMEHPSTIQEGTQSEDKEVSSSGASSSERLSFLEGATTLSRTVELRILNKISTICEPFSNLTDSSSLVMSGLFTSSQRG